MAKVRIELNRGRGWEMRQEGDHPITADELAASLGGYAVQYPHRAYLDGVLIATATPVKGEIQGKVERHEAKSAEPAAPAEAPVATTAAPKAKPATKRRTKAAA